MTKYRFKVTIKYIKDEPNTPWAAHIVVLSPSGLWNHTIVKDYFFYSETKEDLKTKINGCVEYHKEQHNGEETYFLS